MGLLDAFRQYVKDAMPGGLLNAEWTPQNVRNAGEAMSMIPNPVGDVASGLLAVDDVRKGDYGSAALNGLGLLPFIPAIGGMTRAQAKLGGEIADSNGYFYKGGQFLPSTDAEPGRWKVGKKWITTGKAQVGPGEWAVQPTPFSRPIWELLGVGNWVEKNQDNLLSLRKGINAGDGTPISPDLMIRPGVKGVLGKEELSLQDLVDAYNKGQRWFDVAPDAAVLTTK